MADRLHNPILTLWDQLLPAQQERTAVFGQDGNALRTFGQIENEARQIELLLSALPAATPVGLAMGNVAEWPAALLACWRRGLCVVPLGAPEEGRLVPAILDRMGIGATVTVENNALSIAERPGRALDGVDLLKLTSGTTGAPRGVKFRAGQLLADAQQILSTMKIGPDDINLAAISLAHSYGFSNLLTPLLCAGISVVLAGDRLPRALLAALAASRATVFPGVPAFFQALSEISNPPSLPSLRLCISAGAPLRAAVAETFTAKFRVPVHIFYGSSECGGICYVRDGRVEDGLVGEALDGVRLELSGDGRLTVRSDAVSDGYFPEEETDVLGEGAFRPADLVKQTLHCFYLDGRVSDLINIAGRKVNPAEIETALLALSGVRQCVVFAVPSAARGEEPVACFVGEVDEETLRRHAQASLPAWQVPRAIWRLDELPTDTRGKISRRALAERWRKGMTNGE